MADETRDPESGQRLGEWALLVLASLVVGAIAGALGAAFRTVLRLGDDARDGLVDWANGVAPGGWLAVVAACAAGAGLSVWLVRREAPQAAGSGIPRVEGVLLDNQRPGGLRTLPVKFVSGALAIGSGLALGREGPTVQMGATVGEMTGRLSARMPEASLLIAAGAGAGLAAAFNAPLAGAVFVVEELVRRFSARLLAAALLASASSVVVLRLWLGDAPEFDLQQSPFQPMSGLVAFAVLGVIAGVLGIVFNRSLLATLWLFDRTQRWPVGAQGLLVGAAVGVIALIDPEVVGGGDNLAQEALTGDEALGALFALLAVRFVLTLASYGCGAAGGLFAPLLVLGSELGRIAGDLAHRVAPEAVPTPSALAVAGMAALFVATVRVPFTGVVLILEMTGAFALMLPVVICAAFAFAVPAALRDSPIYDALRVRDERREGT